MALSGKSMALTSDSELSHSYLAKEREQATIAHHHHGRRVCRNTFLLHGVGSCRLKAIKSHYLANGLVLRRHGNTWRVPSRRCPACCALHPPLHRGKCHFLPGRTPGYKRDDVQLLPCSIRRRRGNCFLRWQPTPPFATCGKISHRL